VALAAGGSRGQDRAPVRVTAHTFGLAAARRVWWAPEFKSRASGGLHSEGMASRRATRRRSAAVRLCCLVRMGRGCGGGRRCCLWSPSVLGPSPHLRPEGSRPVRWCQAGSFLLWSGRVRPDTTGPACLGKPRRCGEGPRTQPPVCGEKDPPKHIASSPDPSPSRAVVRCGAPKCGGRWHRRLPAPPPPPAKRSLLQRPRCQSGLHLPLERQVHRHHRQHRDRHSREQGWEVAAVALRHH